MKALFTLFSALLLSVSVHAAKFEQGTHYKVLDVKKVSHTQSNRVLFILLSTLLQIRICSRKPQPALADGVKFEKVHVAFMGNDMAVPMAKSYATMVALKVEDKMVPAMFNQIHEIGKRPVDEQELKQIFVSNGIDGKAFDSAYNSFVVNSMQKKFDKQFDASTLTGVPGVLVNNKYIVQRRVLKVMRSTTN